MDKFFTPPHLEAISSLSNNWLKRNVICKVEKVHHRLLLKAHKSMLSNILQVDLHTHFEEIDFHHILKIIYAVLYLLLKDVESCYQF